MNLFSSRIKAIYRNRRAISSFCDPANRIWAGLESRYPGENYRWEGIKRPSLSPHGSEVIIQVTLHGEGEYREGREVWRMEDNDAFFAHVPSDHVYQIPPDAKLPWTFFYLILEHPYLVERLARLNRQRGPVITLTPQEQEATATVFASVCQGSLLNPFLQEQALFRWWMVLEEQAHRRTLGDPGSSLKASLMAYTREHMELSFGVESFADTLGISRTHFSHYFRKLTGDTPAKVILQTRLEAAANRLLNTTQTLDAIASDTGFANANHFGKAFRRHYGTSPGQFRNLRKPAVKHPRDALRKKILNLFRLL